MRRIVVLLSALLALCAATLPAAAQVAPLTDAQRQTFHGSAEDPPAVKLLGVNEDYEGRSYLAGDEWNLHLYYPAIKNLGGGYVGVGSDQGYMMMSWLRPEFAWLIDYDPNVLLIHKVYHAFFLEADGPRAFMKLWKASGREDARALLERTYADDPDKELILKSYNEWRKRILNRHLRLAKKLEELDVPYYASSKRHYTFVREMIQQGRVRPMQTNLLDDEGLVGISKAAGELGVTLRVIYLSNAQEYWEYPDQFRANAASWPVDKKSYVLHTLSTWSTNKDYRYVLQKATNFKEWMSMDWNEKVYQMVRPRRKLEGPDDIDFIELERNARRIDARRKKQAERAQK